MPSILEVVNAQCPDLGEAWDDLVRRAEANVFMHPAAARAAHAADFSNTSTLLAWDRSGGDPKLVGLWTLQKRSLSTAGLAALQALPYSYAFLSNPVVDRDYLDSVIPAFLDLLQREKGLGRTVHLKYLDADSATGAAIERALVERGASVMRLAERERPFVTRTSGQKLTGSTRKKLKQDRNRLCGIGKVAIVNDRAPVAVTDALEVFLRLEAASWKGENGTALLSRDEDAAFARRLVADLAAEASASVALLQVDGKPIAAQVLLFSGTTAYTWKTAFDASFAKFSPGTLLVDQLTQALLCAEGGMEQIESCSPDGGFMEQLWSGRRRSVELLADVGPRTSLSYIGNATWLKGRAELKSLRKRAGAMALLALVGLTETP